MLQCNLNSLRRILLACFFFQITPSSCRAHHFSSTAKQTPLGGLAAIPSTQTPTAKATHLWDGQQPTTYTTSRPVLLPVPLHVPNSSVDWDIYAPQYLLRVLACTLLLLTVRSIALS